MRNLWRCGCRGQTNSSCPETSHGRCDGLKELTENCDAWVENNTSIDHRRQGGWHPLAPLWGAANIAHRHVYHQMIIWHTMRLNSCVCI